MEKRKRILLATAIGVTGVVLFWFISKYIRSRSKASKRGARLQQDEIQKLQEELKKTEFQQM